MNIDTWMQQFVSSWKNYDLDSIISLFEEDIEYWETPFQLVKDIEELRSEWEYVKIQKNIEISYEIFSQDDTKFTILWNLKYENTAGEEKIFAGTYLIKLNSSNKCTYFHHTCEEKK